MLSLHPGFTSMFSLIHFLTDLLNWTSFLLVLREKPSSAYTTLLTVHKTLVRGQPHYFREKLTPRYQGCTEDLRMEIVVPRRQENTLNASTNLTISRGGFFFRGAILFNNLPHSLRTSKNEDQFNRSVRKWIKENIDGKP